MTKFNRGTALITGGSKRIGAEIAKNLARIGYDIVISYNHSKPEALALTKKIRDEFSVRCEAFQCDLLELNQTKKLAEFVRSFSRSSEQGWSLLINNASIFNKSNFIDANESEMWNNINLHLISPLILAKELTRNLRDKKLGNSQIINITDANVTRTKTNYFYYLMSKKFLVELTKMLSVAIAPEVRVNAIAPGLILENPNEDRSCEEWILASKKTPLKTHKGSPDDIWQAIEFLIKSDFTTGQILFVDGGQSYTN